MTANRPSPDWERLEAGSVGRWSWRVNSTDMVWDDAQRVLFGARDGESAGDCWARVMLPGDVDRRAAVPQTWRGVSLYRIRVDRPDEPKNSVRWILSRVTDSWTDPADGSQWLRGVSLDVTAWRETTLGTDAAGEALPELAGEAAVLEVGTSLLDADPHGDLALLVVNIDAFTLVNDALGRKVGDDLLREVVRRLTYLADPDCVVGHVGGDEFLLLLPQADLAAALAVAESVTLEMRRPVTVAGRTLNLTVSVGVAGTADPGTPRSMTSLRHDVDLAVHEAKRQGGDRWVRCESELRTRSRGALRLQADLREALESPEQLALHYQPAFSLRTGRPVGVEGLLRWTHPTRGMVPPLEVVGGAEHSGMILPLGDWVLSAAVEQAARWRDIPAFTTWFNVSPRQLVDGDLPGRLLRTLGRVGLPAERIGVEVTESVFADGSPALALIEEIQSFGVKIAIDDFGTGYSSLSRLLHMPVDLLKIDRSFVEASDTLAGHAVLAGIISLGHGLGAQVVAEGVETPDQLQVLRDLDCDEVAGYLFSPPRPVGQVPLGRLNFREILGSDVHERRAVPLSW